MGMREEEEDAMTEETNEPESLTAGLEAELKAILTDLKKPTPDTLHQMVDLARGLSSMLSSVSNRAEQLGEELKDKNCHTAKVLRSIELASWEGQRELHRAAEIHADHVRMKRRMG